METTKDKNDDESALEQLWERIARERYGGPKTNGKWPDEATVKRDREKFMDERRRMAIFIDKLEDIGKNAYS